MRCIATWGRPTPRLSFRFIYDASPSSKSLDVSIAFSLLTRFITLWHWAIYDRATRTFDLSSWTLAVGYTGCACVVQTILHGAKSSNPRRTYCDFNNWPNDLEQNFNEIEQPAAELTYVYKCKRLKDESCLKLRPNFSLVAIPCKTLVDGSLTITLWPTSKTVCDLYFIVHFVFLYCELLIVYFIACGFIVS